jgi:hypothetical protein
MITAKACIVVVRTLSLPPRLSRGFFFVVSSSGFATKQGILFDELKKNVKGLPQVN